MKVLHISSVQSGGAGWCAIRINKALAEEGIDSRMLFAEGNEMPEGVEGAIAKPDNNFIARHKLLSKTKHLLLHFGIWPFMDADKLRISLEKANQNHHYLHQPLSNYTNIAHHPLIEWADIIHLHYVSEFVDYPSFFKNVKKPIVWTLHDKYPTMGVNHSLWDFTPVPDSLKKIDKQFREIKRQSILKAQHLNIVAISEAMVDICKNSEVLKGFPVTLIHNGVDINVFHPKDKQEARQELGLRQDAVLFLFSAYYIHDPTKGLNNVIKALEKVDIPNKTLLCMGHSNRIMPNASFPIILTGCVRDENKVSNYFAAADYFIQSSMEETFAQTPLEAMACGTPVISTPCSGAADLIRPNNGVICLAYDSEALAQGIGEAIKNSYNPVAIRKHITDNYQYDKIAMQYIYLYQSIM